MNIIIPTVCPLQLVVRPLTEILLKEWKHELDSKKPSRAHWRIDLHSYQCVRMSQGLNMGHLEFSPHFKNQIFATDVIWLIGREKPKESEGRVEGWLVLMANKTRSQWPWPGISHPWDLQTQKQSHVNIKVRLWLLLHPLSDLPSSLGLCLSHLFA